MSLNQTLAWFVLPVLVALVLGAGGVWLSRRR